MSNKLIIFTHIALIIGTVKKYVLGLIEQFAKATVDAIEELHSKIAGVGGTVTYKIPKEYYQTGFGDDPYSDPTLNTIRISLGKAILYTRQMEEDIESGVIKNPEDFNSWSEEDQIEFKEELCKKYMSFEIKPWVPTPRISWFDLFFTGILETTDGDMPSTCFLNKIWNNDFKVSIHAENQEGEVTYICVKSDIFYSTDWPNSGLVPFFGFTTEEDAETGIDTVNLVLFAVGASNGYCSDLSSYTSYVTNDDVKEVTITFIPNNIVVEEYKDEQSV